MIPTRKKPGLAFWVTVAVTVVLVGYPLSIGPEAWFETRGLIPEWAHRPINWLYAPRKSVYNASPEPIRKAFRWYCGFWVPADTGS